MSEDSFMEELQVLDRALARTVTISSADFWSAVNQVWQGQQSNTLFELLAKKLGLETK